MRFLRRLFGLDFPDPQVGQVWRSRYSGRYMRVTDVHTMDTGSLVVSVKTEDVAIGQTYAHGLDQWRWRLRDEARELIEGVPMEPSRPWPRGVNFNRPPHYPKPPAPPSPPGAHGFTPPPPAPPRPGCYQPISRPGPVAPPPRHFSGIGCKCHQPDDCTGACLDSAGEAEFRSWLNLLWRQRFQEWQRERNAGVKGLDDGR